MFDWLVARINESLLTDSETRAFIGVLDIFGFEQFEVNSFEQLCINFANERLQAHFNSSVFKTEQEIYIREAIRWDPIDEPDNQACIEMLANPAARAGGSSTAPVGLFALLDEQCRLPKCTHKTFTEKIFEVRLGRVSDRGQGASSYTRAAPQLTSRSSLCRCTRRRTAWGRSAP